MMINKRLKLSLYGLLWLLLFMASLPHSAHAQDDLRIQQMRVQVMPEFDDPRVLVIVQGRLNAAESTFPRPVTFLLPADAQINQMASMDVTTGQTNPLAYETLPYPADPRWTAVTYTLDNAHFFYEFYYDPLQGETDKQFTYAQATPLPIDDLLVELQEPRTAVDFTLEPVWMFTTRWPICRAAKQWPTTCCCWLRERGPPHPLSPAELWMAC
jgi:hypothetical protein